MTFTFKLLVAAVLVVTLTFVIVGSTRASDDPQIVHVTLKDNRVELSQSVVASGKLVSFVVSNESSTAHQFVVEPYVSSDAIHLDPTPLIASGTTWTLQRTLATGVYRVTCANPDHAARGLTNALAADALPRTVFPTRMEFAIPVLGLLLGSVFIIADSMGLRLTRQDPNNAGRQEEE